MVALSLAATGVYAVTSFLVVGRLREIGIRMALGANARQVARTTMAPTLRFAAVGAAAGVLGAVLVGQALRATLYDTSPVDPRVLAGAVSVLFGAVLAASYVPLRRALSVDPVDVLRS